MDRVHHRSSILDKLIAEYFEGCLLLGGFNNRHPEFHAELIERTNFLPPNTHIECRMWHLYYKQFYQDTCSIEGCSNGLIWLQPKNRYAKTCSRSCATKLMHLEKSRTYDKK